ncbi:aminopeptidase [Comamonas endophytica]|uniref:Aminopeptidase n=1 Tax=Comamonas endophytica TaxID=2949090 RepID=A0ABY6G7M0_9BURK|nr:MULTISPECIES: aminopeptidase [unclassified Acidovorax]MCD2510999.1 aminopeptidase [Acidovorax sp. D4N7]UYG50407.1 aminopeptidase [Acidovorax sp. 5MLIR]
MSVVRPWAQRGARALAGTVFCALLAGCAVPDIGYYWQGARGQLQMLHAARPVADWLEQQDLAPALRSQLLLARQARDFASQALALPDNASYRRYAALQRPAAVWNVTAAPPDALELHQWCFPVAGCVGYRGYFALADAQAQGALLAARGLDVHVYPVPAYSTLGYFNWLGGDPLLDTFVRWPEGELVGLLFHELAHQRVYLPGDMAFNESYATAVEQLGTQAWLRQSATATAAATPAWQAAQQRRTQYRALAHGTRQALEALYAQPPADVLAAKAAILEDFRARYAVLRAQWLAAPELAARPDAAAQSLQRLDRWVAEANNASFGALSAYDLWVPAFTALFAQQSAQAEPWAAFHRAVEELSRQPEAARLQALCALMPDAPPAQCDTGAAPLSPKSQ